LATESAAWDAERASLEASAAIIEDELALHDDIVAQLPRRRSVHMEATAVAREGERRADERCGVIDNDVALLNTECSARSTDINAARAAAVADDEQGSVVDARRERAVQAHREWSREARVATDALAPATQAIATANTRIARSYDAWYRALVSAKSAYGGALGEYAKVASAAAEARVLVDMQRRVSNALIAVYVTSFIPTLTVSGTHGLCFYSPTS